jgi:prepilin-type N-terminal cleavage/methylation domain-containing protein
MVCSLRQSADEHNLEEAGKTAWQEGRYQGRSAQAGMTFIEPLLVTAIIGILTAVAMPNIKNLTARQGVGSHPALTGAAPGRGSLAWRDTAGPGLVGRGKHHPNTLLRSTNWRRATRWASASSKSLCVAMRTPTTSPGLNRSRHRDDEDDWHCVFRWRCGHQADGTDVDPTFLPGTCRGF